MFGRKNKTAPCDYNDNDLILKSCHRDIKPLSEDEIKEYASQLSKDWLIRPKKIIRIYSLDNYNHMIELVNKIAEIAEREDHHPLMHLYYCRLEVEIFTFSMDCLSENDFILAAKMDKVVCCP